MLAEVVTVVRAAPEVVFDLDLDADVHTASMAGRWERATTSTGYPLLAPGDEATFTARHLGLRWRLTSRITDTTVRTAPSTSRCAARSGGGGTSTCSSRSPTAAPG